VTILRQQDYYISLVHELRKFPGETEWLEFKCSYVDEEDLGEYISALSNSAAMHGKVNAYMVWGVDDQSHEITGTTFDLKIAKVGAEELENWLLRLLAPKIDFQFFSLTIDDKSVVLLEIGAAFRHPVAFKHQEFIRVGTYKKKLKEFPEKERALWRIFDFITFEREVAAEHISVDEVLRLLDYPAYFDLLELPLPESRDGILGTLEADNFIVRSTAGRWDITNLGAVLFAKKLSEFRGLRRKAIRVILYKGESRVKTIREQDGTKGYASGFEGLIGFITNLLPSNEVIGKALRKEVPMFPELAIRELVANALIHQDFHQSGTEPMIEIFSNRMEITNPGLPLVQTDRFLNSPPKSRNEVLASFMRRVGICEERGTGIDKVVFETEFYQLPAPIFETTDEHTRTVLFAYRKLADMDKEDRVRACYLHACLRYAQRDFMTNSTLRERFGLDVKNSALASRIINDTIADEKIRCYDESVGPKARKYLPKWA
jgi:predicted HTH transcriptional regulator